MSMTKKKFKICRRLGAGVFEQCQTPKFMLSQAKRAKVYTNKRRKRVTDYGLSLIEKQKIRLSYGLRERQFANYVKKALSSHEKTVAPAQQLFHQLESRLDNIIYRAGYAHTRSLARQLASHGHFTVNGKRTTVPSYLLKKDDIVAIREGSKNRVVFNEISKKLKSIKAPNWLSVDDKSSVTTVKGVPDTPDSFLNFQSVIEFYSK